MDLVSPYSTLNKTVRAFTFTHELVSGVIKKGRTTTDIFIENLNIGQS